MEPRPSADARGRHAPWVHLAATLAWTWACWGGAAATADDWLEPHALVLFVLGGLGPLLVATVLVGLGHADESLSEFWRRALDPRRMAARWWLVVTALAVLPPLVVRLGTQGAAGGIVTVGPVAFLVVGALAGAAEEPGWRGYAQEGLQRRMSVLAASLVVGVAWAAWHLPLFWIAGTYQHGLGVGTQGFWTFHLAILAGTVVYAWVYNAAGRVTLAAVWLHAAANAANELFAAENAEIWSVGLTALIAAAVIVGAWRWLSQPVGMSAP
jgi:uncharacterized protein